MRRTAGAPRTGLPVCLDVRRRFALTRWRCPKSISTGGHKTPPKTRPMGSGPKTGPHRCPQNCTGTKASPINESVLPCRPLRGRILSGAPAPHSSANPMPGAPLPVTPPLSRRILPLETSRHFFLPPFLAASFPADVSRRGAGFPPSGNYK
jgi:hypothetical protein